MPQKYLYAMFSDFLISGYCNLLIIAGPPNKDLHNSLTLNIMFLLVSV